MATPTVIIPAFALARRAEARMVKDHTQQHNPQSNTTKSGMEETSLPEFRLG
jgi:hypothetical protein